MLFTHTQGKRKKAKKRKRGSGSGSSTDEDDTDKETNNKKLKSVLIKNVRASSSTGKPIYETDEEFSIPIDI